MTGTDEARLAGLLLSARRTGRPVNLAEAGPGPADAASAYRVQALVAEGMGPVAGWKTGRTSPDGGQTMAPIFAPVLRPSPASFSRAEAALIGVELEIAFLVERPLPPADAPDFEARARDCVAALAAIEVVDTRLADHEGAGPLWKLADNQINAGLVVGEPRRDWQTLDLARVEAELAFGDQVVVDGPCPVPGGDAYRTFCAFARMVGGHCGGLRPGQYVTTGSLNGLPFIARGTPVRGRIAGLGAVAVDFPP